MGRGGSRAALCSPAPSRQLLAACALFSCKGRAKAEPEAASPTWAEALPGAPLLGRLGGAQRTVTGRSCSSCVSRAMRSLCTSCSGERCGQGTAHPRAGRQAGRALLLSGGSGLCSFSNNPWAPGHPARATLHGHLHPAPARGALWKWHLSSCQRE